jgi:uncharacterized protein YhaN
MILAGAALLIAAAVPLAISGAPMVSALAAALGLLLGASALVVGRKRGSADPLAGWEAERATLEAVRGDAEATALAVLVARGAVGGRMVRELWAAYQLACSQRAITAAEAERAESLRREIAGRRVAEDAAEGALRAIGEIESALRSAADRARVDARGEPNTIVDRLRAWQASCVASRRAGQIALDEWRELSELLKGGTPLALAREASRLVAAASEALEQVEGAPEPIPAGIPLDRLLEDRREAVAAAEREWHELKGALDGMGIDLPSVAEAEEQVETAEVDLRRVEALATTIDETLRLLRDAQDKVHRDLAPILAGSVRRWLPLVSGGAYVDVSVDPATLAVRVKEARIGQWRTAALLSEGTREQIYLLLRVGMAQHLVTTGETAPLLLDEVTAQSDASRRLALLTVLQQVSLERQVIMFTHDAEVARWANEHLDAERDRLVELPSVTESPAHRQPASGVAPDPVSEQEIVVLPA